MILLVKATTSTTGESRPSTVYFWSVRKLIDKTAKLDDALADLSQFLELVPEDPSALEQRLNVLFEAGQLDAAMDDAKLLAEKYPEDLTKQLLPASLLFAGEDYEGAIEVAESVIDAHPKFLDARRVRGNSLLRLKRYDESLEAFGQALEIDSNDAVSLNNRAAIFSVTSRFEEAIAEYTKLVALQPEQFDPAYFLCYSFAALEQWEQFEQARDSLRSKFGQINNPQMQLLLLRLDLIGPQPETADWTSKAELAGMLREAHPGHEEIAMVDAAMQLRTGKSEQAEEILAALIESSQDARIVAASNLWLSLAETASDKQYEAEEHLTSAKGLDRTKHGRASGR